MIGYIITALCNFFLLIVIWHFFDDMFERKKFCIHLKIITGVLWFLSTYLISEYLHSAVANIIVSLVFLYILLICYDGSVFRKIIAVFLVECINGACDYLSFILFSYFYNDVDVYSVSYIGTVILAMICEVLLRPVLKRNKRELTADKNMIFLLIIPINMLVVLASMMKSGMMGRYFVIVGMCALITSFVTFELYNVIILNHISKIEKESFDRQINIYKQELERIEKNELRIEGIRHDLRHHIIEMESLISHGETDELIHYLADIKKDVLADVRYSQTGRYEVDSLVNYLIKDAGEALSSVDVKMTIPHDLNVNKYHLNIILGNLLENAIEASKKSDEKTLKLLTKVERNVLYIDIENSYKGHLYTDNKHYISSKQDAVGKHGLGLSNVERIVKENGGDIVIDFTQDKFRVRVMIFI